MGHDRVLFLKLRENVWQYFSIPIDFGIPLILFSALGLRKVFKPGNKKK
jgi:spore germination protein KB